MNNTSQNRIAGPSLSPAKVESPVPTADDIMTTLEQFGRSMNNNSSTSQDGEKTVMAGQDAEDEPVVIDNLSGCVLSPDSEFADHDDLTESTSISNSYCGEWEKLFMRTNFLQTLRSFALQGKLRSSRFRSVCWRLYLGVLPGDTDEWISKTNHWRQKYNDLKERLVVNPHMSQEQQDLCLNNPLSQENESPWNQFFQDNELRLTIKQDVIRTFPEVQFFHDSMHQETMTNVLFCYAKEKNLLSYKQGMHELLAPLIFVLHCDHQAFLHACEIESVGEVVKVLLDPDYVEHDAYAMFCHIMETMEPWYVSKEISPPIKPNDIFTAQPFARVQDCNPSNVIVTKLTRIQDYLLKKFDPEMQAHLEKMEIAPQIYGIRWVRLLFGREFPMQDLLMLWDAIFADSISFDLVDYIFVGMLQYIRDAMLTSDYPSCLHLLMKFPPVGDVHYFIDKAIYLREPNQHPKPPDYTWQKPPSFGINGYETNGQGYISGYSTYSRQSSTSSNTRGSVKSLMSGFSTLTKKINQTRPGSLKIRKSPQRMSKSTSEPMNLITDQSPDQPELPDRLRKASTASLSQIEDDFSSRAGGLRPALSTQSLARLETTSVRSAPETAQTRSYMELMSPGEQQSPSHKYNTLPSGGGRSQKSRKKDKLKGKSLEHDYAMVLGRLHDLQMLCRKCAERMDYNVAKLQKEMLRQHMENEDELLLALAGLKQVRDVMKGTLKSSCLYEGEDINIQDNHYSQPKSGPYSRQDSREDMLSSGTELSPENERLPSGLGTSGPTTSYYKTNQPMNDSFTSTDSAGYYEGAVGGDVLGEDGLTGVERHLMQREIELHEMQQEKERERESLERRLADQARLEREAALRHMSSSERSSPVSDVSPNGRPLTSRPHGEPSGMVRQQVLPGAQSPLLTQPAMSGRAGHYDNNQNTTNIKPASLPVSHSTRGSYSNEGSRRSSRDSSPMEKISGLFRSIKF